MSYDVPQPGSTDSAAAARPHPGALAALSRLDGPPAHRRHSALPEHPSEAARDADNRSIQAQPDDGPAVEPMPVTGHEQVDRVLAEVDTLTERALEDHLEVFTRAHESLRGALQGHAASPAEG